MFFDPVVLARVTITIQCAQFKNSIFIIKARMHRLYWNMRASFSTKSCEHVQKMVTR